MITHPSLPRLSAFASGELDDAGRTRVARHLERCARCRRAVTEIRETRDALREATAPAPPAGAWEAIAARVSAGEQVILPAAQPEHPRRAARPFIRVAAVLALLLAGGAAAVLSTREAVAEVSELTLSPDRPGPGATIQVAYRPATLLAGADRLVLRARLVDDQGRPPHDILPVRVAELRRDGGVYRGSFVLPDSIVYAVFAVENADASRVDHNGEAWDLMVHDAAGRPLPRALLRRSEDLDLRDLQASEEAARQATELYPDFPAAWQKLYLAQIRSATQVVSDSLEQVNRARVRALSDAWRTRPNLTEDDVSTFIFYADNAGDTATAREWKERLYRDFPTSVAAYQQRVFELMQTRGDHAAIHAEMERLWTESRGTSGQLAFTALQMAAQARDAQNILLWGDRMAALDPRFISAVARYAMAHPSIRPQAMDRVRRALRWMDENQAANRPLTFTAAEMRRMTDAGRGYFLGVLGRALMEAGQTRAGMDTLQMAMGATWDPALFRSIADARLAQGDTAGAVSVLARVAADPVTPGAFADSARTRLGRHWRADAWAAQVRSARGEMRDWVMQGMENRAVRGDLVLTDTAGAPARIEPAGDGPTFVAFWSRWCPPSRMQLTELQRLATELRGRGVRVVTVAEDARNADFREFVRENGFTFPIYFDTDRAARRALQNQGTPTYLVLDASGRIRFDTHSPEDVLRQVEVLRN
ncbi:redoxin domain-containing protein [Longimicrobium sp.]|uniref:redoxin domain-containing protein n=1 Tax=Longimicrobium sp. TaxID=2029185 RepID=UPI002E36B50A|nr:redoxin domain-containing protein [Longimicrobium sp.]HEX6042814.1 redoxin domain-containing protein [Longimicrobium sp.]